MIIENKYTMGHIKWIWIGDGWAKAVKPALVNEQSPLLLNTTSISEAATKMPGFICRRNSINIASWSSNIYKGGSLAKAIWKEEISIYYIFWETFTPQYSLNYEELVLYHDYTS